MRLFAILFCCCAMQFSVFAQSDSTTLFRQGLPVSDDDTVQHFPAKDFYPRTNIRSVRESDLPQKVVHTLNRKSIYEGWNRLPVYHDLNTDIFYVRVVHGSDTASYGLNRNGKAVSYGRKTIDDE
jgi:hypothetical protein